VSAVQTSEMRMTFAIYNVVLKYYVATDLQRIYNFCNVSLYNVT
jgi:hypothetical protein